MNKYLENFYQLYAEDDAIVYQAILEKKNWILKEFYIVCSLDDNRDLEDILDGNLRFRKLYINPILFNNDIEKCKDAGSVFDAFRVLYLWDEEPLCECNEFIVKLDFRRLDDEFYKKLFANFFPCIHFEEIPKPQSFELNQLLPIAMDDSLGDAVIIVDDSALQNNCLNIRLISEIIVPSSINKGYVTYLEQIANVLKISFRSKVNDYKN